MIIQKIENDYFLKDFYMQRFYLKFKNIELNFLRVLYIVFFITLMICRNILKY
jgi:hypothetical protein